METICSACSTEYRILISRQQSWVRSGRQVRLLRELRGITEDTTFVHRQDHGLKHTIFMRHRVRPEGA